jgi:hypothetical protein
MLYKNNARAKGVIVPPNTGYQFAPDGAATVL